MTAKPIDSISFTDGIAHDVFMDADGRQYVLNDAGDSVYGVGVYIDEAEIVPCAAPS